MAKVTKEERIFIKEGIKSLKEWNTWYLQPSRTIETTKYKNIYTYNYDGLYYHLFLSLKDVILFVLGDNCLRLDITEDEYNKL